MKFLKKRSPEEWLRLEDSELDEMIKKIDHLPKISNLSGELNELRAALHALKGKKDLRLAQNVHIRARDIHKVLEELTKEFGDISDEAKDLEGEINKHLKEKYFNIQLMAGNRKVQLKQKFNEPLVLGTSNIQFLPRELSRKQIEIVIGKDRHQRWVVRITNKGIPLFMHTGSAMHPFHKEYFPVTPRWIDFRFQPQRNVFKPAFKLMVVPL